MKKIIKSRLITLAVFLLVAAIVSFSFMGNNKMSNGEALSKCIGEKAVLYVQLGCSHCGTQEKMFGDNIKYIKVVDCFSSNDPNCQKIRGTPTWIIGDEKLLGIQSIDKLKEATKC